MFIVTSGALGGGVGQDVIPACGVDVLQQLSQHHALDQQGLLLVLRQWGNRRCLWVVCTVCIAQLLHGSAKQDPIHCAAQPTCSHANHAPLQVY